MLPSSESKGFRRAQFNLILHKLYNVIFSVRRIPNNGVTARMTNRFICIHNKHAFIAFRNNFTENYFFSLAVAFQPYVVSSQGVFSVRFCIRRCSGFIKVGYYTTVAQTLFSLSNPVQYLDVIHSETLLDTGYLMEINVIEREMKQK